MKRPTANGLWFTTYAVGNVAGASIFFERKAPRYYAFGVGGVACLLCRDDCLDWDYVWVDEGEKLEEAEGFGLTGASGDDTDAQAVLNGLQDLADMESKHFQYALLWAEGLNTDIEARGRFSGSCAPRLLSRFMAAKASAQRRRQQNPKQPIDCCSTAVCYSYRFLTLRLYHFKHLNRRNPFTIRAVSHTSITSLSMVTRMSSAL